MRGGRVSITVRTSSTTTSKLSPFLLLVAFLILSSFSSIVCFPVIPAAYGTGRSVDAMGKQANLGEVAATTDTGIAVGNQAVGELSAGDSVDIQHSCDTYICIEWLSAQQMALKNNAKISGEVGRAGSVEGQSSSQMSGRGAASSQVGITSSIDTYDIALVPLGLRETGGFASANDAAHGATEAFGVLNGAGFYSDSVKNQEAHQNHESGYKSEGQKCMQYQCFRGFSDSIQQNIGPNNLVDYAARRQHAAAGNQAAYQSGTAAGGHYQTAATAATALPYGYGTYIPFYGQAGHM